jgi:H/ACA ribonucleoprotein complex subunit 2
MEASGKKRKREEVASPEAAADGGAAAAAAPLPALGPACPLASAATSAPRGSKLQRRLFRAVGRAAASRGLRRGVKEVQKALRKGAKGCVWPALPARTESRRRRAQRVAAAAAAAAPTATSRAHFHRLCVLAGDVSPMDVLAHLPVLCEVRLFCGLAAHTRAALARALLTCTAFARRAAPCRRRTFRTSGWRPRPSSARRRAPSAPR